HTGGLCQGTLLGDSRNPLEFGESEDCTNLTLIEAVPCGSLGDREFSGQHISEQGALPTRTFRSFGALIYNPARYFFSTRPDAKADPCSPACPNTSVPDQRGTT